MWLDTSCINKVKTGYKIEKQKAGKGSLRKTFASYEEALVALSEFMGTDKVQVDSEMEITWRDLFKHSKRRRWKEPQKNSQKAVAERTIHKHLGWTNRVIEFDQECVDCLEDELIGKGLSTATINHYFSAIRVMLRDAKKFRLITCDIPYMPHYRQEKTRINYFTYEQEEKIRKIIHFSGAEDLALFFTLSIETGMRTSEVVRLEWRDVDLEVGLVRAWGFDTKTKKDRRIPLTTKALKILKRIRTNNTSDNRVFPRASDKRRRDAWDKVREHMNNFDKDFIWYTTRHTCATRLVKANVDLHTVQTWLGHSCIETTMRYIQFSASAFRDAKQALEDARVG